MGISKKHTPGCTCCTCVIGTDADSYTVCSGTWTASSETGGGYETANSNAMLQFLPEAVSGRDWRVSCKVGVFGTGEFQARLHGGVLDCTQTAAYLEYGRLSSGSTHFYWKLYNAQEPNTPADCVSAVSNHLVLSWDGTYLHASFGSSPNVTIISDYSTAPTGNEGRFGISTGTLGAGITKIQFYDIQYEYINQGNCEDSALHCCRGPVPAELEFELTGLSGNVCSVAAGGGGGFNAACSEPCSDVEGTYFLPVVGASSPGPNGPECGGSRDCTWELTSNEVNVCYDVFGNPINNNYTTTVAAAISTMTISGTARRVIVVTMTFTGTLCNSALNGEIIQLYGILDELQCDQMTTWLNLTAFDTGSTNKCSLGAYGVARIRVPP